VTTISLREKKGIERSGLGLEKKHVGGEGRKLVQGPTTRRGTDGGTERGSSRVASEGGFGNTESEET